jgi:chitinase
VNVTVNGDVLDENDETFGISLSSPTNGTIADGTGVGTITDDDARPSISIADVSIAEGNVGTATLTFVVGLSAASGRTVTVQWATADGDALSSSDYVAASGTLTFTAGQTSKNVNVTVNGDLVAELDEPFTVDLSGQTNATIADGEATGTILDDEGFPVIDMDSPSVAEGNAGTTTLTYTLTLSNPSAIPVSVDWATEAVTATEDVDYDGDSGTVTFPALTTSMTIDITVHGDTAYEPSETLAVNLSNPVNAPIGHARRVGTITNDDAPPSLSVANASVTEGNTGTAVLSFVVTSSSVSGLDASATYATSNGSASSASDYDAATGTVTIPAGQTTAAVDVVVHGDTSFEAGETLTLTLSAPVAASIADGTAQGTILNDDPAPTTITLNMAIGAKTVTIRGVLEPTQSGHRVTVTLYRRKGGHFVKLATKTVSVKHIQDRDGDGKPDGAYTAVFTRPASGGRYKAIAHFSGATGFKPCSKKKLFRLAPR